MAAIAQRDMSNRITEVKREQLLETLKANKVKHIQEYQEALTTYKSLLLEKLSDAFEAADADLRDKYNRLLQKISNLKDEDIPKQRDAFTLVDSIAVEMRVPRSYEKEYDAAIDMVAWDVRETLELTNAEFTCFVRDAWDWKAGFDNVTAFYKMAIGSSK